MPNERQASKPSGSLCWSQQTNMTLIGQDDGPDETGRRAVALHA
jgi:hypothetical protein